MGATEKLSRAFALDSGPRRCDYADAEAQPASDPNPHRPPDLQARRGAESIISLAR
jgi:hypothetical protein